MESTNTPYSIRPTPEQKPGKITQSKEESGSTTAQESSVGCTIAFQKDFVKCAFSMVGW